MAALKRRSRRRDPSLAQRTPPVPRQLDVQAASMELRGPGASGTHRRVRQLVVRGREEVRRRELLPGSDSLAWGSRVMPRIEIPGGPGGDPAMVWSLRPEMAGMVDRMIQTAYQRSK